MLMRHRPQIAGVLLMALILVPLAVSARIVGNTITLLHSQDVEILPGGIDYDVQSDEFAVAWSMHEGIGGYHQPYLGWYHPLVGLDGSFRLISSNLTESSTPPDVACSGYGDCLATWVQSGKVYARKVTETGNDSAAWRLESDAKGLTSTTIAGSSEYVVAWDTTDGKIALRYVDDTMGPIGNTYYVSKPAGCSSMNHPRLAYSPGKDTVAVAFGCLIEGSAHVQARAYNYDLKYEWDFEPKTPVGKEYFPDVAVDKNDVFFMTWQTDLGSTGTRVYGQRFSNALGTGSPFAIPGTKTPQTAARIAYNAVQDEYLVTYEQSGDIFCARIGSDGFPLGIPYALASGQGKQWGAVPTFGKPNGGDRYLVLWADGLFSISAMRGVLVAPEKILDGKTPFSNETEPGSTDHYQAPAPRRQWQAIGMRPGPNSDYDIYVADGPDYANVIASSTNFTGTVDAVVMNGRRSSQTAYFPLLRHYGGDWYSIENATSSGKITQQNNSSDQSMDADSVVRIFEVYGIAGQPINIQVAPGVSDVGVAVFDPSQGDYQSESQAAARADAGGAGQAESILYVPGQDGWLGILIWKLDESADIMHMEVEGAGPVYTVHLPFARR